MTNTRLMHLRNASIALALITSALPLSSGAALASIGIPHMLRDSVAISRLAALPVDQSLSPKVILVADNISTKQIDDLAKLGQKIERKDDRAAELRRRQSRGANQFGFDVGIGVTKSDTLAGPGKARIGDALSAAERQGFDIAVTYSLERNKNAKLAAVGALIAREDPEVQDARTADRDVFYWLGFDIASGIYGDPAMGAQGNTATGPGAFKIRDALSAAGQRGFNDSVAFHLARTY